jgi:hypothetical protein
MGVILNDKKVKCKDGSTTTEGNCPEDEAENEIRWAGHKKARAKEAKAKTLGAGGIANDIYARDIEKGY